MFHDGAALAASPGGRSSPLVSESKRSASPMTEAKEEVAVKRQLTKMRRGSVSLKAAAMAAPRSRATSSAVTVVGRPRYDIASEAGKRWCFVMDEKQAWVPAIVLEERKDGSRRVQAIPNPNFGRDEREVPKAHIGPDITSPAQLNEDFDDMVKMLEVNEASVLHNLRGRFMADNIYTNIGSILVSINPFKWMDHLYTWAHVKKHLSTKPGDFSAPHVFAIASAAFCSLRDEHENQSIIISGESGAGKTEATKKCLQFFAEAGGSRTGTMEKKLLSANPILESFGNAKTVRNNNSSRFGKWMAVHFDERAMICGSTITNYLLEKSRVVFQAERERNFHIFYQMCLGLSDAQRARYGLPAGCMPSFRYLSSSGCMEVDGIADDEDFKGLMDSLADVGFPEDVVDDMFRTVAAVLHLGNVSFDAIDLDSCEVSASAASSAAVTEFSRLMRVDPAAVRSSLKEKLVDSAGDRVHARLSKQKAEDARNSLARTVYGKLFDWLVQRVNVAMAEGIASSKNVCGVLDIFGFEIFGRNSFEQMCINYCNEKLQQHFNAYVFKQETTTYDSEGIDYTEVRFIDNQDVLDLIEKKPLGLLPKLDDETRLPRGTSLSFLDKINKAHAANPRYKIKTRKGSDKDMKDEEFGIAHYAGVVVYDVTGFLEKNKDELHQNLRELMAGAGLPFVGKVLFEDSAGEDTRGRKSNVSQGAQFKNQLDALMETLRATEPHFIRCMKPNDAKEKDRLDAPMCLQQLRYAGVFEAVKIRQLGFPFRWTHDAFFKRYRMIGGPRSRSVRVSPSSSFTELARVLLAEMEAEAPVLGECRFGKTMVLYRADQHRYLEAQREISREKAVRFLERIYRGHAGRIHFAALKAARAKLMHSMSVRDLVELTVAVNEADQLWFELRELPAARVLRARLEQEKRCRTTMQSLVDRDPIGCAEEYGTVIEEATSLGLQDLIVKELQRRLVSVQFRVEAKKDLENGTRIGDKGLILSALDRCAELAKEWGPVATPQAAQEASNMLLVIQQEEVILGSLRSAISSGSATGTVGQIDTSSIRTAELERGIAEAESHKLRTLLGQQLVVCARIVMSLRIAMRDGNYEGMVAAVEAARVERGKGNMSRETDSELQMAQDEVDNEKLVRKLQAALLSGRASGTVGFFDTTKLSVAELDAALSFASSFKGKSPVARQLENTAIVVSQLRKLVLADDWNAARDVIKVALEMPLAGTSVSEVEFIRDEMGNRLVLAALLDALNSGAAGGTVGAWKGAAIDTSRLRSAIATAREVGVRTDHADTLLQVACIMLTLRELVSPRQWDFRQVGAQLASAASLKSAFVPSSTVSELRLIRVECENRLALEALSRGLLSGCATGRIGALNVRCSGAQSTLEKCCVQMSVVSPGALGAAISQAVDLEYSTVAVKRLVKLAEAVRSLREEMLAQRWAGVQAAVSAIDDMDAEKSRKAKQSRAGRVVVGRRATRVRGKVPPPPPGEPAPEEALARGAMYMAQADEEDEEDMFELPPVTKREVEMAQDELDNRAMLQQFREALSTGGAVGPTGGLDATLVETEGLLSAIELATRLGPKTADAQRLLLISEHVLAIRQGQQGDDYVGAVQAAVKAIDSNVFSVGKMPVDAVCIAEVECARAEVNYHIVVDSCLRGLAEGAICGPVGAIAVKSISTRQLADAILLTQGLNVNTVKSRFLLSTAEALLSLRRAVQEDSWHSMEGLLASADKLLSRVPPGCEVPVATLAEVRLARDEMHNRSAVAALSAGLRQGAPEGDIGHINFARIDIIGLNSAIELAQSLTCKTQHARQLLASAGLIRRMRQALVASEWTVLETALSLAAKGSAVSRGEGRTTVTGPEGVLVAWGGKEGYSVAMEGLGDIASAEIGTVQDNVNNRNIIVGLTAALRSGFAVGPVGLLDVSCVSTTALDLAIARSVRMGCKTRDAELLLSTAQFITRLRSALVDSNWQRLEALISEAHARVLADTVADEVRAAQDELDNRTVVSDLTTALSTGMAVCAVALLSCLHCALHFGQTGDPGKLYTASVQFRPLQDGIALATKLGAKTDDARVVLFTAKAVLRLRQGLLSGDYNDASVTLAAIQGKKLASVAMQEIRAVQDEVDNWKTIGELSVAIAEGGARGEPGQLSVRDMDTHALQRALRNAEAVGIKSAEARELVVAAEQVFKLRCAIMDDRWDTVATVVAETRHMVVSDLALDEFSTASAELSNRAIISMLTTALARGCASGHVGEMDLATIDTSALDKGIATAMERAVVTKQADALLRVAKLIRRLRAVLLAQNWDWIAQVIAEAKDLEAQNILLPCSVKELQFARDEIDNRKLIEILHSALSSGCASGETGGLDVSSVSVTELDSALAFATATKCKTPEAVQLLGTAQVVRELRVAVMTHNFEDARDLLESVRGRVLALVAADEVQAIKFEVDNWLIVVELTGAISSGAAAGGIGRLDTSAINVSSLDVAIALSMRLGCRTAEARKCLLTALIVRRLRAALLGNDWKFVAQVLEEASVERENILDAAAAELQAARDEMDFRKVVFALRVATEKVDDGAIEECLASAAKLRLSDHPDATVRMTVEKAILALARLRRCNEALEDAVGRVRSAPCVMCSVMLAGAQMDRDALLDGVAMATELKFDTPLVSRAKVLLGRIRELTRQAQLALKVMQRGQLEDVVTQCQEEGVDLAILGELRTVLSLPDQEFLKRELVAAIDMGDKPRVVNVTVAIKDAFFAEHGASFALNLYPNMKPAHVFSRKFGIADAALRLTMLSHTADPIHTSLTLLNDPTARRFAVKTFRAIMAFMGDRVSSKPLGSGEETVAEAIAIPELRDEVFVQICKQVTDNPSEASSTRGWVLMQLCLDSFPPSEDLENYLELFLREHGALACVQALHATIYSGPKSAAPNVDVIVRYLELAGLKVAPMELLHDVSAGTAPAVVPAAETL